MNQTDSLALIIPVRNEFDGLKYILPYKDVADEIIFVDGNSTDGTPEYIKLNFPEAVLIEQKNFKGKGSAIALGLLHVKSTLVMQVDADFPISTQEIQNIKMIMENNPEIKLVKPSRHLPGGGSDDLTKVRLFGAKSLAWLARKLHRVDWTEVCYAMWAIRADSIHHLNIQEKVLNKPGRFDWWLPYAHGFEFDQYVFFTFLRADLKILEIPTIELERKSGGSSLFAPRDGLRTLWIILKELANRIRQR